MAARPYRAWRGAIEFAGFPVNVALYSIVKPGKGAGFRQLSPAGNPIQQQLVDSVTGEVVERANLQKGIEYTKGAYRVMSPDALAQIDNGVKTEVAKPMQFVPAASIDWTTAIDTYEVQADDVPGAHQSTNVIWNGLKASGLAYVTQVSMRGSLDRIMAIRADEWGLWAATLPYRDEFYANPPNGFMEDPDAASLFGQVVEQHYGDMTGEFDREAYASEYNARRDAAIASVLNGETVEAPEAPKPQDEAPDLMALMQASLKAKKAPAKAKTKAAA